MSRYAGWWQDIGCKRYPDAKRLTSRATGGGSNGSRVRLWKLELQKLANELGIASPSTTCRLELEVGQEKGGVELNEMGVGPGLAASRTAHPSNRIRPRTGSFHATP